MKSFVLAVVTAFISISLYAQPTITSFTPLSATAGSTVTITGTNFSATASENVVYFGFVKAKVNAASATQLTVTVPTGASYAPITVTTGALTAYSQKYFIVLLPGGPNAISTNSFPTSTFNITEQTKGGFHATMADFDGDGKVDIFATRFGTMNVHRNTTATPNVYSFEKGVGTPAPAVPTEISTGDLNGDGKLDVVAANYDFGTNYISVWLNTTPSAGSPVEFSARQDISTAPYNSFGAAIHDMNGDGKPDILIANYEGTDDLTILTNTTTGDTFTYTITQFAVSGGGGARKVVVADFDNDGKPDVAIANGKLNRVHVLRNTSVDATAITFATKVDLIPSNTIFDIATGDMNSDGRIDIETVGVNTPRATSVFRNIGSAGLIKFAARVDFTHPTTYTEGLSIHDLDGDAKPDLVTSNYIVKNTSAGSTSSGEAAVAYEPNIASGTTGNFRALANDLDGDGIPEIIGFRTYAVGTTYYSGIVVQDYIPKPIISAITPTTARLGDTVNITGTYMSTVTGVKFGNASEITSFTVNSPTSITAVITDATSGSVTVNSPLGSSQLAGFILIPGPKVTSFSPSSGPVGTVVTISGTNFGPTPSDNRVLFGAVRATITEASATTIKAIVPAGYEEVPITVGYGIQTSSTTRPFRVTFSGGDAPFNDKTMSKPIKLGEIVKAYSPVVGDFDNDNKPDIAAIGTGGVYVFFNATINGAFSMTNPLTLAMFYTPTDIAVVDVDGDGLQDIVTANMNGVGVFRNTTVGANKSFDTIKEFGLLPSNSLALGDIDGDGRPDVVSGNPVAYVGRNLSVKGSINFASAVNLPGDANGNSFAIADLDQDGKSEIIMPLASQGLVNVYPNASTPAVLSLSTPIQVTAQTSPDFVSIADLDGNNLPEIIVLSRSSGNASAILNGSTAGLAFSPATTIDLAGMPTTGTAASGDINGDANPDITLANNLKFINLMKNTTPTGGAFSFETFSKTSDAIGYAIERHVLVDIDGNGELDIVGGKSTNAGVGVTQSITVLRNQINEPIIDSFTPTRAGTGTVVTISGDNLSAVTQVWFGGTAATSFEIVSAHEIRAVIGSGTTGDLSVTNGHFVATLPGFVFFNGPIISSFDPTSAGENDIVTITGIQFTGATGVSFGDVRAVTYSVVSPTTITAKVGAGASGKVKVTNSFGSDEMDGFSYKGPLITSFAPTSASMQDSVTITGTQFINITAVSFGGVPAAKFRVVSPTSIIARPASGASGKVKVTGTFGSDDLPGFTYLVVTAIEPGVASSLYDVEVYPNPSNGCAFHFKLNDAWEGKKINVVVTDMMGRTILSQPMIAHEENHCVVPAGQSVRPGTYLLSMGLNERRVVKKLIVSQ